jgi:hypothetical protein
MDDRVKRLVGAERRQPNGTLFEPLVASAYRRAGAEVAFRPEAPGQKKTHDLDVAIGASSMPSNAKGWRPANTVGRSECACGRYGAWRRSGYARKPETNALA